VGSENSQMQLPFIKLCHFPKDS